MTDHTLKASKGWLVSSSFEGRIDTKDVNFRQSSRNVTLYGRQETADGGYTGIQIDFHVTLKPGLHPLPHEFQDVIRVSYFRQTESGLRTSYPAKSGELFLTKWDDPNAIAEGKFRITAEVDDTPQLFDGAFSIAWVDEN